MIILSSCVKQITKSQVANLILLKTHSRCVHSCSRFPELISHTEKLRVHTPHNMAENKAGSAGEGVYNKYAALNPFFDLVQRGLAGLVDGDHYFDTIADNASFEFRYTFPGYPQKVDGRDALMKLYSGYGNNITLHNADALVVHRSQDPRVVILEYEVHGTVLAVNATYTNRFVSIVTIENRKIVGWRDYMDSLAAMTALSQGRK